MNTGFFYTGVVLLLITSSVFHAPQSYAGINQWTATGLTSSSVSALAIDPKTPTTVYAGDFQGLFKTVDGGATWKALSNPLPAGFKIIVIDPINSAIVYAAFRYSDGGDNPVVSPSVVKSTDGGTTWREIRGQGTGLSAFVIDPKTPTTLYVIVDGQVQKSVNGGESWTPSGSGITEPVQTFALDPTTPTTLYAGGGTCSSRIGLGGTVFACSGGVFKSTDSGTSWSATPLTEVAVDSVTVLPTTPATVYASGRGSGRDYTPRSTARSVDGGKSWETLTTPFLTVINTPTTPNIQYATGPGLIIRSLDGGQHWASISANFRDTSDDENFLGTITPIVVDPQTGSKLYAATTRGVLTIELTEAFTPDLLATVESPEANQPVSGIGMVRGWAFVPRPGQANHIADIVTSTFFFGNQTPCCSERGDVRTAFPQFPPENTLNSGWGGVVNWGALPAGPQHLSVSINSADRTLFNPSASDFFLSVLQPITVVKPGDFAFLDQFVVTNATATVAGSDLVLSGVVVRDKASQQRKQVNLRYRWFTNSQSVSLTQAETLTTFSSRHERIAPLFAHLTKLVRTGLLLSAPASAQAAGTIQSFWESPEEGQVVSGLGLVRGWAFPEGLPAPIVEPIITIVLSIDGTPRAHVPCCTSRGDVAAAFPADPYAEYSGWGLILNYGDLSPGTHTLSARLDVLDGVSQTLTRTVRTLRIGGFTFIDQFDLTTATARIEGEEIVLSGVQVHDKATQQSKRINVRLRWFQHSQSLGIVATTS